MTSAHPGAYAPPRKFFHSVKNVWTDDPASKVAFHTPVVYVLDVKIS